MSTLTQSPPDTAVPARLLSVPLAVTFLAEFTSLTSFFLLLSVMPMLAAAAGAGSSAAGLITGSLLLGTVAAEVVAAAAIRRFGYRMVLAAGAVLLGAPALAMLVPEPQAVMVGVSVVRGLGFGLCGVATGALTATLLPPGRRGEGLGLLGLVSGVPAVVALPAGVWLAGHHLAAAAAAMAATAGLLSLVAVRWLPGGREARPAARTRRVRGARSSGRPAGAALRLPLIFAAATIAAGVLDSFLPLTKGIPSNLCSAALLVQAITATLSRGQARRPLRSRPAARPGARGGGARHGRDAGAGLARGGLRRHGAVRRRVRGDRERDVRAADRADARGQGQRLVELRLRRGLRRGPGRLRPDLRPHRLPGGIRPYRRVDPRRGPGRIADAGIRSRVRVSRS